MNERSKHYHKIFEYKRRKEDQLKKYIIAGKVIKNLTRKIYYWEKQIKRIDERNSKISELVKKVNEYFHVRIQEKTRIPEYDIARKIYYKIGTENNISGKYLSEHIGRYADAAFRGRNSLTKSFNKNTKNKEAFHAFKTYIS